jgi:MGT family glycosyltransferase
MTRFLFISAPLAGHLDWGGYLRTAAALVQSGHDVTWASDPLVAPQVTAAGVPFTAVATTGWHLPSSLPADLSPAERAALRQQRAIDAWLDVREVRRGVGEIARVIESFRPDVIASELFVTAAPLLAEKHEIPLVICGWPAQGMTAAGKTTSSAAGQVAQLAQARLQQLWELEQISGRHWSRGGFWPVSPQGHVVYFSRAWYGEHVALLPYNQYVGGQAAAPVGPPPAWLDDLPIDRPLVLITLGSLFVHDEGFFLATVQAVLHAGGCPIVAAGSQDLADRLRQQLPADAVVQSWVAYDWLLPRLDLVIHHGGVGTTHAAIVHGVPQIIVPHAGDQANQARRAAAAGIALTLAPAPLSPTQLAPVVGRLLSDPRWRERATVWQNEFARLGGVTQAARWMSKL